MFCPDTRTADPEARAADPTSCMRQAGAERPFLWKQVKRKKERKKPEHSTGGPWGPEGLPVPAARARPRDGCLLVGPGRGGAAEGQGWHHESRRHHGVSRKGIKCSLADPRLCPQGLAKEEKAKGPRTEEGGGGGALPEAPGPGRGGGGLDLQRKGKAAR